MKIKGPLKVVLVALGWMVMPFAGSLALMRALERAPSRVQQLAFCFVVVFCAFGEVFALAKLEQDLEWSLGWRLTSFALKVIGFVCLLMFTGAAAIAGYYALNPRAPAMFGGR